MSYNLVKKESATTFHKNGVDFIGYGNATDNVAVVIEEVEKGHFEEFVHTKSTFIYIFLEGKGTFVLDDEKFAVQKGDMLVINPGTRIHYFGTLKQVLITSPAYEEEFERHIRNIEENESPYLG